MSDINDAQDGQNFNALLTPFSRNIYATRKGALRLAILQHDLAPHLPDLGALSPNDLPPNGACSHTVLDLGCGMGQMALWSAMRGYTVHALDKSSDALAQIPAHPRLQSYCASVFAPPALPPAEVIFCHALLEWLPQQRLLLAQLESLSRPGALLSLMIFNRHSLTLRNALRGNFRRALANTPRHPGSLTPSHPLDPVVLEQWLDELGWECLSARGVRVFHDYLDKSVREQRSWQDTLEMELQYSEQLPFLYMGRYIHYIARRR